MLYCAILKENTVDVITSTTQRVVRLTGGGIAMPDVAMHRRGEHRAIVRYDDKTALVIFSLAKRIEQALGKDVQGLSSSIKGIFQQVRRQISCGNFPHVFWL